MELLLNRGTHSDVDILEDLTWRNPWRAVGGLNQIIASLTAMFPSERIPELQRTSELLGPD